MRCLMESPGSSELLVALAAGRLEAPQAATVQDHVRACPACSDFLAAQTAVWNALDVWDAPAVSPDFDRRLYRRIEQNVPWWDLLLRPFRPAFAIRFLPAAAAAGLLLIAGFWIERPGEAPRPSQSAQIEALPPEQGEPVLQEMQMMQEFSGLVHADTGVPRM